MTSAIPSAVCGHTRADGTPLDGTVLTDLVSPGFFDLFRFCLLRGRDVSWDDGLGKPAVALISAVEGLGHSTASIRARWPGALASGTSHVIAVASSASANATYIAS